MWAEQANGAWLLRGVSVSLYTCIEYTKARKYSFHSKQDNGEFADAKIDIPDIVEDLGETASKILQQSAPLLVKTADGFPETSVKSFRDIFRDVWEEMCRADDLCRAEYGKRLYEQGHICGYDISEVIYRTAYQVRKLRCTDAMKCWEPLVDLEDVQVIFCQSIEDVITPSRPQTSSLSGSLRCLFRDFKGLYGHKWNMESDGQIKSTGGLPMGNTHRWIPNQPEPISGQDDVCACSRLQSIVPIAQNPSTRLKKRNPNKSCPQEPSPNSAFVPPDKQILMTFGQPAREERSTT
jgi:hypothetical protein